MKTKLITLTFLLYCCILPQTVNSKTLHHDLSGNENDNSLYANKRIFPGTNTQVQTSIAVHPSNDLIMAASAITDIYPGGYTTGAYFTSNGGANWTGTNSITDPLNNIIFTLGDPTIVIDKNGTIILTYTAVPSGISDNKVGVSYSTNNGLYWSPTVFVPGVGRSDKPAVVCDNSPLSPYFGKIYIVYSDFLNGGLYFSSSGNGGLNWDSVTRISLPIIDARVGASLALGKYGDIYVSWPFIDIPTQRNYIGFARSTNGGQAGYHQTLQYLST